MCISWKLASMASVRGVNVPMYTTLRRTTVAFTMVIEYMLSGQRYTRSIIGRWITFFSFCSFCLYKNDICLLLELKFIPDVFVIEEYVRVDDGSMFMVYVTPPWGLCVIFIHLMYLHDMMLVVLS